MNQTNSLVVIRPLTTVTVDTILTPLLATRSLAPFRALYLAVINDSAVNPVTVTVETGEASDALDAEHVSTLDVPVAAGGLGGQRSLLIGPDQMRDFYRVSAQASGAPASVRWVLKGILRYGARSQR